MAVPHDSRSRLVSDLATELIDAGPALDGTGRRLAVAVYRLLARGTPVTSAALGAHLGVPEVEVEQTLSSFPGVYRDEDGAVVGFWGLSIGEMPHRLILDRRTLYTWCAWDALFIPPILQRPAQVESACAVTGESITLTVTPQGVEDVTPASAVVSLLRPDSALGDDIISSFCHHIVFFRSPAEGTTWTAAHSGTLLLTPDEGFQLGLLVWGNRLTAPDRKPPDG